MSKTIVLIYKLPTLYEILSEINDLLNFELQSALDELELSNIISCLLYTSDAADES